MSVADRPDQGHQRPSADVDLSDLGLVDERALLAARADLDQQAERRAALQALEALEREGRLLIG